MTTTDRKVKTVLAWEIALITIAFLFMVAEAFLRSPYLYFAAGISVAFAVAAYILDVVRLRQSIPRR